MADDNLAPLSDRLESQFNNDVSPDDPRGQVFHGIGYMQADVDDPELRRALDVLSEKLKDV